MSYYYPTRRVPIPIPRGFRALARRERRSIAEQAVVVLEKFVQQESGNRRCRSREQVSGEMSRETKIKD
jgi:hypothetical protein